MISAEIIMIGLNVLGTAGIWHRLGTIVERSAENRKRIVRLEGAVFTHD